MKNNITELVFILDRSGSMSGLESDTIGGFNSMIEKQKKQEGGCYVSTVLFDDESEVLHDRVKLEDIPKMTDRDYTVRGCTALIDAIGGVTVYSDYTYMAIDTQIYRGENYLSGYQALCFARERTHVPGGDTTRGKHQMRVVKAAIQKMTSSTALITGYADILDSLSGMFRTNVSVNEMSHLVKMQLDDMATWEISTYGVKGRGDGSGVMAYTYSAPDEPLWVLPPDYEAVAHASMLIEKVVTGGIITEEDLEGPAA